MREDITFNVGFTGSNRKSKHLTLFNCLQHLQEKSLPEKGSFVCIMSIFADLKISSKLTENDLLAKDANCVTYFCKVIFNFIQKQSTDDVL